MTPDQTEKLKGLISEYSASLTRSDAERDLQGAISEKAKNELMIEKKHFTAVAKAHYKERRSNATKTACHRTSGPV